METENMLCDFMEKPRKENQELKRMLSMVL